MIACNLYQSADRWCQTFQRWCQLAWGPLNVTMPSHDDVMKWMYFPRYWPIVRGIHRSPVNSPHKDQWREALVFQFRLCLNKRLSKQSWRPWFETPSRSLWRHCNRAIYLSEGKGRVVLVEWIKFHPCILMYLVTLFHTAIFYLMVLAESWKRNCGMDFNL